MNINYQRIVFFLFLFVTCSNLIAQTKVIPYQQLQGSTGMFFGASMTPTTITVTFEGPSNKWIALGLGLSMTPADALVYTLGQLGNTHPLGWTDYFCGNTSASNVTKDNSQDWTIISNLVTGGQRTVVATRILSTGDASDVVITFTSAALNIVWARGATNDYTLAYHGSNNRGNGIVLPWLSQPTASFSVNSQTVCVGSPVSFTNLSSGGQTSYTWALPGTVLASSTATNPVVTYSAAGVYSVALTATNVVGTSSLAQIGYITVNPTVAPALSITQTSGSNPICQGSLASFSVSITNGGPSPQFQWRVNNQVVGTNASTFSSLGIPNAASIICILTSPSVCASPSINTSAAIVLTVNSNAPATVSININAGTNPMCLGALTSFTALAGNGGTAPSYQWKINGVNVGTGNSTYTSNSISNGDVITCSLVSNASCAITNTALSSAMVLTVSNILVPSVFVSPLLNSTICLGTSVSFTALPQNGGANPSFQWVVNGNNAGPNNPIYTFTPTAGFSIECILTSNSPCSSPNTATSVARTVVVNPIPPTPSISPFGTITLCSGTSTTLTSSAIGGNLWSSGATSNSIVVAQAGNYFVTQMLSGCNSAPSNTVVVNIIQSPTTLLSAVNDLCINDNIVNLLGTPPGGTYSGIGVSGNNFYPNVSGTGSFVVNYHYTDANNCSDTSAIVVRVSECVGITKQETHNAEVSLYPNPNNGHIVIHTNLSLIHSIIVRDINGKIILFKQMLSSDTCELENISDASGIYDAEIMTNFGVIHKRIQVVK